MLETHDPEIRQIVQQVETKIQEIPLIGFILGSGLGEFAEEVKNPIIMPTSSLPDYPRSTVSGHAGKLVAGRIGEVSVMIVQGRVHYYEGYPISKVVYPVRLLAALGAQALIVTNAAGGMGEEFQPGDLMAITDQVNLMGVNPLVGQSWGFETFPDMTDAYDPKLRQALHRAAKSVNVILKEGVLGGWMGPSYETATEVRLLKMVGVSAACMSTIPEVIAAARLRLRLAGISCITNMATGFSTTPLTHEEVKVTAAKVQVKFRTLLKAAIPEIAAIIGHSER